MKHTDRRLAIVLELETHPWRRAADLASTFGVSTRTIYRDMDALAGAGLPVVAVPGKGYRLEESFFLPPLTLTSDEAVLLLLGVEAVADRLGVLHQAAARAVRARVEALLPDRLRAEVATLRESLRFVPANAFDDPTAQHDLALLHRAIAEQRAVQFVYGNAADAHTVHPYGLMDVGGAWLLLGHDRDQARVRSFHLRDVTALEALNEPFERPAGYERPPDAPAAQRALAVHVRFDAEVARWVQEAPSAYVTAMEPRAGGLHVTLTVQREAEVLPWLLSWGAHAHVLHPPSLQRRLADEAAQMAARYQPGPTLLP